MRKVVKTNRVKVGFFLFAALFFFLPSAHASPQGDGWGLIFADEFSGTALDTMKWNYNYPWGPTYNHEAYMLPQNVSISNGQLLETAYRESYGGQSFTSGAINSSGKFNLTQGYIEGCFKMPATEGTWPVFCALQDGWPPEIDIIEVPAVGTNYWASYHYGADLAHHKWSEWNINTGQQLSQGFHTFGVEWNSNYLKFYFDGAVQQQVSDTVANISQSQNMYLLINLAIGGRAGTPPLDEIFPTTLQCDWIRVWKKTDEYPASTAWILAGNGNWDTASSWSNGSPQLNTQIATFGDVGISNITVDWSNSRTVGGLIFNSETNYTLGNGDESIMLSNTDPIDPVLIDATTASGSSPNIIDTRLELYDNLTIRSPIKPLTINGNIVGSSGLRSESGLVTLNGDLYYNGPTTVSGGELVVNGDAQLMGLASILYGTLQVNSASASMHDITGAGMLIVGDGVSDANLTVDSISIASLTISSGSKITIRPIGSAESLTAAAQLQQIPEPSSFVLILISIAGFLYIFRQRN